MQSKPTPKSVVLPIHEVDCSDWFEGANAPAADDSVFRRGHMSPVHHDELTVPNAAFVNVTISADFAQFTDDEREAVLNLLRELGASNVSAEASPR